MKLTLYLPPPPIDNTLSIEGATADAKAVGDALASLDKIIAVDANDDGNIELKAYIPGEVENPIELDETLSIKGKAADAKAVGDAIRNIDIPTVPSIDTTLTIEGATADAKAVGEAINTHTHTSNDIGDTIPIAKGGTGVTTEAEIGLKSYPVGSIYMSTQSTSPASLFGGSWTQIKDTFLLAAGSNYSAGNTGGAATVALTTAQLPSHNHTFTGSASNTGGQSANHTHTATTSSNGSHYHSGLYIQGSSNNFGYYAIAANDGANGGMLTPLYNSAVNITTGSNGDHTHSLTTSAANVGHTHSFTPAGTISNTGSGSAHNNMPPYLAVYIWKRTA